MKYLLKNAKINQMLKIGANNMSKEIQDAYRLAAKVAEENVKLSDCPLCGSSGNIIEYSGMGLGGYTLCFAPYCSNENCHLNRGIYFSYPTKEMAAEEWNKRPVFVTALTKEEQAERMQELRREHEPRERERSDREEHSTYHTRNGEA